MIVTRVHAGGGDRADFVFGQIDVAKLRRCARKRSNSNFRASYRGGLVLVTPIFFPALLGAAGN
jgi:hypothetical protein